MVQDMGLKITANEGRLEWQHMPTKFHENPPIGDVMM
jgi:hypothetical protein